MKVISSKSIVVSKKVFPILWFGFLAFFILTGIVGGAVEKSPMFLVVPVMMAVIGYFVMKKLVWDLMDEVEDHGEYLLVRYKDKKDIIYLNNIMNVSASTNQNPPRITLRLRSPGRFGDEVAFTPVSEFSLNPFKRNRVADELILRVDQAKR